MKPPPFLYIDAWCSETVFTISNRYGEHVVQQWTEWYKNYLGEQICRLGPGFMNRNTKCVFRYEERTK